MRSGSSAILAIIERCASSSASAREDKRSRLLSLKRHDRCVIAGEKKRKEKRKKDDAAKSVQRLFRGRRLKVQRAAAMDIQRWARAAMIRRAKRVERVERVEAKNLKLKLKKHRKKRVARKASASPLSPRRSPHRKPLPLSPRSDGRVRVGGGWVRESDFSPRICIRSKKPNGRRRRRRPATAVSKRKSMRWTMQAALEWAASRKAAIDRAERARREQQHCLPRKSPHRTFKAYSSPQSFSPRDALILGCKTTFQASSGPRRYIRSSQSRQRANRALTKELLPKRNWKVHEPILEGGARRVVRRPNTVEGGGAVRYHDHFPMPASMPPEDSPGCRIFPPRPSLASRGEKSNKPSFASKRPPSKRPPARAARRPVRRTRPKSKKKTAAKSKAKKSSRSAEILSFPSKPEEEEEEEEEGGEDEEEWECPTCSFGNAVSKFECVLCGFIITTT